MSYITIEQFDNKSLDRAEKLLAGIPGGAQKAVQSAMPRAVQFLRRQTYVRIRGRYDISEQNIRLNENVRVSYRIGQGVEATITYRGKKIPLYRYGGTSPKSPSVDKSKLVSALVSGGWKKVHPGKAASAHQLTGTPLTTFENAFIATVSNDHTGIFERVGNGIEELMGSSVPQMIGNEQIERSLAEDAQKKFEERMEHEINRLMNGLR